MSNSNSGTIETKTLLQDDRMLRNVMLELLDSENRKKEGLPELLPQDRTLYNKLRDEFVTFKGEELQKLLSEFSPSIKKEIDQAFAEAVLKRQDEIAGYDDSVRTTPAHLDSGPPSRSPTPVSALKGLQELQLNPAVDPRVIFYNQVLKEAQSYGVKAAYDEVRESLPEKPSVRDCLGAILDVREQIVEKRQLKEMIEMANDDEAFSKECAEWEKQKDAIEAAIAAAEQERNGASLGGGGR